MVLSNQQKTDIAQIALNYMAEKGITAKQFSLLCKVGESYLSAIVNNSFEYSAGNETQVMIADKYFVQIAEVCDYSLKKTYWNHVVTPEFKEIIYILNQAKLEQGMRTLVVDSGSGKSYAINKFKQNNPAHTFVLTMHSLMSVHDLFYDLIYQLGINDKGNTSLKRSQIIIKLREIKKNGGYPIIIIDEAENMNASMMRMLKGLYDGLIGYASLVMVGTMQLWEVIERARMKDKQSGPQFYRRFKTGKREIKLQQRMDIRFAPFFEALKIEKPLQKLLCTLCDNYGELHDYVEYALRRADEKGLPLTAELFKLINNIA